MKNTFYYSNSLVRRRPVYHQDRWELMPIFGLLVFIVGWSISVNICHAAVQKSASVPVVNIGILAHRGKTVAETMWTPTIEYLNKTIPNYSFNIIPLNNDSMTEAVKNKSLDFVLTNPANYATLETKHGVTRIATLKAKQDEHIYTRFGSVIFAKNGRNDIKTLSDLKGKSFMAVHPKAFGGWWMALDTLKSHGINPAKDFTEVEFSGFPQDIVVYSVKNGGIDAGTVRTGLLEKMAKEGKIELNDFSILNVQNNPKFKFIHSTQLYPEWAFASASQTNDQLAHKVAIALLSQPGQSPATTAAQSGGWTVPHNYHDVHELMRRLNVGVYKNSYEISATDVMAEYGFVIVLFTLMLMGMTIATVTMKKLNQKLKQSKIELEKINNDFLLQNTERQRAEFAEHKQADRINSLYEVTSISGLTIEQQIEETLNLGCMMFDLQTGAVCEVNEISASYTFLHMLTLGEPIKYANEVFPLSDTFCEITVRTESAVAVHDIKHSEYRDHPAYTKNPIEAYLAAPLWVNNRLFGAVQFTSREQSSKFTKSDKDLVRLISRWISVALERRATENEIEQARNLAENANVAKSSFLASMSHEFRTPLNAIIGYSELLYEEFQASGDTETASDLLKIKRTGHHLLNLINEVLDLSKEEAGKMDVNLSEVTVNNIIDDVENTIRQLAENKNNTLHCVVHHLVDTIISDEAKLRQVLINLLSNANKFTDNGHITLTVNTETYSKMDWLCFRISDTGTGISMEDQQKLFQEFTQVGETTNKQQSGTGLGLVLSRKICRLLGGDITVQSALNIGSTFIVKLPQQSQQNNEIKESHVQIA